MRQKKIKIVFCGRGFLREFFNRQQRYDVEIVKGVKDDVDLILYTSIPYRPPVQKNFDGTLNCLRVFFTGENVKPDFRFFDYAFSFEETDDKNFCFPIFAWESFLFNKEVRAGRYSDEIRKYREHPKSRFCAFVHRAAGIAKGRTNRIEFCRKLMSYKRVDCPGLTLNNMPPIGHSTKDKLNFTKQHKFVIAFENTSSPNYVTEKIFHALLVNSIPIYWGSPRIAEYFNPEAFINCHDYDSFDQVMDRVIEVDNNDDLYQKYVNAPPILEGSKAYAITEEAIMERLDKIMGSIGVVTPVSSTLSYKLKLPFYRCGYYLKEKYNNFFYHLGCWLRSRGIFWK